MGKTLKNAILLLGLAFLLFGGGVYGSPPEGPKRVVFIWASLEIAEAPARGLYWESWKRECKRLGGETADLLFKRVSTTIGKISVPTVVGHCVADSRLLEQGGSAIPGNAGVLPAHGFPSWAIPGNAGSMPARGSPAFPGKAKAASYRFTGFPTYSAIAFSNQ